MDSSKHLIHFEFTAKPWQYSSEGAWPFVSLPKEMSKEIRENFKRQEEGWGRLKVTARTGGSEWKTAIWFDTKHDTYLLPLKAEIRRKEKIELGKEVTIVIYLA